MAAVLATGLVATSCSQSGSTDVQSIAETTPTSGLTATPSSDETLATTESPPALEVATDGDDAAEAAPAEQPADESDGATTTAAPATDTTVATTPTTAAPVETTVATTAAPDSTAAPDTTAAPAGVETRPEILRLALPVAGGGTFDPNSVAGKNVVLWFWGAH